MRRVLSTILAVALLLGLGALAVLALPNGNASLAGAPAVSAAAPEFNPDAPDFNPDAPASTSGINWLAIPLANAALTKASHLAASIETVPGTTVSTVESWNPQAQNYLTYLHGLGLDDFDLTVGGAYRVTVGGGSGPLVWSLVGDVPAPSQFTYTLYETASSDFNWIMLPLDKNEVTMASSLAADIQTHSSAAVTVEAVEQWNASAQNYLTYLPAVGLDDYEVKIGYPYRITVNVATASSVTWPVR